ncbi:MAG TPA: MmgE/PrpD family protein [Gemmatimonadaceae bacterium]|nr:MmgE/PrpD family protein [Gemmatimonadaceae bacterium]
MVLVRQLADFAARSDFSELSDQARLQLRIRILDSIGCALGALGSGTIARVRDFVAASDGDGPCTLTGGGRAAPDRAALLNGALVRYLDFNDSYLAPDETCHPSDNLGAVLAASEAARADGRTLLTALAVAYQIQCRLSDEAPVRDHGFDHVTHLAYSASAGAARALGLDAERTANAVAIAGTALNALRVTRTGTLSNWKGLAAPFAAANAVEATLLASRGITGPEEVFEGNKGFMQAVAEPFSIDWAREDLDLVNRTILKRYNAEIHSQSAIEAILDLRRRHGFTAADVEHVVVEIFGVAHRIIGGGEEGDKLTVITKEDADHSLRYMLAVALLDGEVLPRQYTLERIREADVQTLLRRVVARPRADYSTRFPTEMAVRVLVTLTDGRTFDLERFDYPGFSTRPMTWDEALVKYRSLGSDMVDSTLLTDISAAIGELEHIEVAELTRLLARAGAPAAQADREAA